MISHRSQKGDGNPVVSPQSIGSDERGERDHSEPPDRGSEMSDKSEPDRCFACQTVLKMGGTISPLKFGNQIAFLCLACEEKYRPELHELDRLLGELSQNPIFRLWLKSQRNEHHH